MQPVPDLVLLSTGNPVTYRDQLGAMETVWRGEFARPFVIANFAPFTLNSSWCWFRFPNGHLILFSWPGIAGDLGVGIIAGLILMTVMDWMRRRDPRFWRGHCSRCGYDLTGNASGICPECGCPAPPDAACSRKSAAECPLDDMESMSALAALLLLLALPLVIVVALVLAQTATEGQRAGLHVLPFLVIWCALLLAGWVRAVQRFRELSAKQTGWKQTLAAYHFWVILLTISSVGCVFLVVSACTYVAQHVNGGEALFARMLAVGVCALLVLLYFWVRWGYQRATDPLVSLQRAVALRLAADGPAQREG